MSRYRYNYCYDELVLGDDREEVTLAPGRTTAVVLVQPIGVGIGRWYYGRLLISLREEFDRIRNNAGGVHGERGRIVLIVPDLLGCGSACDPTLVGKDAAGGGGETATVEDINKSAVVRPRRIPLLGVNDWSDQIASLMADYERGLPRSTRLGDGVRWCVLANGGCTPVALAVGEKFASGTAPFRGELDRIVLSAPPRLPTLLRPADATKVDKNYRTLSGLPGRLFWWYALRKDGAFVRKFSEKNLMSRPDYLGEDWTPRCVETARACGGKSRYSTFAFLAGSLQIGYSQQMFDSLKGSKISIDIIRGSDKRPNKSRR